MPDELKNETREYLDRPFVGVGVVIWRNNEFLLIKRGKPPRAGEWSIPGGGQELGETVRETAHREVDEETGLKIEIIGLIDVVDSVNRDDDGVVKFHVTLVDYCARWRSGEAIAGTDAADVGWFKLQDLPSLGLWTETNRIIQQSWKMLERTEV